MKEQYIREALVFGKENTESLRHKRIAVFGLGGVGGNCVEALARSGIGTLDLIDHDEVDVTNMNRQVFATHDTIGMKKVDAAEVRVHAIDPDIIVHKYPVFYLPQEKEKFPFAEWDYIIDAIDTVTAKLDLIEEAKNYNIPILCAMGCGNRTDPSALKVMDLFETKNDPLARIMRHEVRKRGIRKLKVCCSTEPALKPCMESGEELPIGKRSVPGSTAFVPPAAGILIASYVVKELMKFDPENRK